MLHEPPLGIDILLLIFWSTMRWFPAEKRIYVSRRSFPLVLEIMNHVDDPVHFQAALCVRTFSLMYQESLELGPDASHPLLCARMSIRSGMLVSQCLAGAAFEFIRIYGR